MGTTKKKGQATPEPMKKKTEPMKKSPEPMKKPEKKSGEKSDDKKSAGKPVENKEPEPVPTQAQGSGEQFNVEEQPSSSNQEQPSSSHQEPVVEVSTQNPFKAYTLSAVSEPTIHI